MFEIDLTDLQEMKPVFARLYGKRDRIKNSRPIPASALNDILLSTVFHHKLVWVHPFFDGNGRTVRLAMNVREYMKVRKRKRS